MVDDAILPLSLSNPPLVVSLCNRRQRVYTGREVVFTSSVPERAANALTVAITWKGRVQFLFLSNDQIC